MADALERLNALKTEIGAATASKNKLEGERGAVVERMNTKHGVTTVPTAKKMLGAKQKELTQVEGQIETGLNKLEEDYQW